MGAKANPPKKLRSPPKKGNVIARNMVSAAPKDERTSINCHYLLKGVSMGLKLSLPKEYKVLHEAYLERTPRVLKLTTRGNSRRVRELSTIKKNNGFSQKQEKEKQW